VKIKIRARHALRELTPVNLGELLEVGRDRITHFMVQMLQRRLTTPNGLLQLSLA
jgi:hypothetical protein